MSEVSIPNIKDVSQIGIKVCTGDSLFPNAAERSVPRTVVYEFADKKPVRVNRRKSSSSSSNTRSHYMR